MNPLTTNQLDKILKDNNVTKRYFLGTLPACTYPLTNNNIYSFITNTDEHDKTGQHWNSWFVRGDKISFFDSFGRSPDDPTLPHHYRNLILNFRDIEYSRTRIQGWTATTCGLFCIHYIYVMSLGLDFKSFIAEYSKDFEANDDLVFDFVDSIIM